MDESFLMRARRLLGEPPTRLAHDMLVARVSERQAQTPTARISAQLTAAPRSDGADGALADLLLGAEGWRSARIAQGGCFSRASARRRGNAP